MDIISKLKKIIIDVAGNNKNLNYDLNNFQESYQSYILNLLKQIRLLENQLLSDRNFNMTNSMLQPGQSPLVNRLNDHKNILANEQATLLDEIKYLQENIGKSNQVKLAEEQKFENYKLLLNEYVSQLHNQENLILSEIENKKRSAEILIQNLNSIRGTINEQNKKIDAFSTFILKNKNILNMIDASSLNQAGNKQVGGMKKKTRYKKNLN